jgi:hypothetical protein
MPCQGPYTARSPADSFWGLSVSLGSCPDVQCDTDLEPLPAAQARAQDKDVYRTEAASSDEGVLMASTSVFVLDPGSMPSEYIL